MPHNKCKGTRITPRQKEILDKVLEGKSNKIIAYESGLEESTVKVHIRNLMQFYKATSRNQMIHMVYEKRMDVARKALMFFDHPVAIVALEELANV